MAKRRRESSRKKYCEFFAGIGLVRAGLDSSSWECVYANDHDPKKQEQYVEKYGSSDLHLCDVFDTEAVAAKIPGNPVLATASFPCVDLSVAGHYKGIDGSHSSALFGFLDCLKAIETPQILLLENIVGLLSSKNGADFQSLCHLLADAGYWLDAFMLDAKYFVPQSRPRVFIVGLHDSAMSSNSFPRSTDEFSLGDNWRSGLSNSALRPQRLVDLMCNTELSTGWFASGITEPVVQRSELKALIDTDKNQEWWSEEQEEKHYNAMSDLHRGKIDAIMERGQLWVGTIYRRTRKGATRAEVRFDGIAGCLRTPKGGSARQIVVIVQKRLLKMRWMSPREYARLQGASDFPLVGTENQQLFGFGDAVCVPVIKWIDEQVLSPIAEMTQAVGV